MVLTSLLFIDSKANSPHIHSRTSPRFAFFAITTTPNTMPSKVFNQTVKAVRPRFKAPATVLAAKTSSVPVLLLSEPDGSESVLVANKRGDYIGKPKPLVKQEALVAQKEQRMPK